MDFQNQILTIHIERRPFLWNNLHGNLCVKISKKPWKSTFYTWPAHSRAPTIQPAAPAFSPHTSTISAHQCHTIFSLKKNRLLIRAPAIDPRHQCYFPWHQRFNFEQHQYFLRTPAQFPRTSVTLYFPWRKTSWSVHHPLTLDTSVISLNTRVSFSSTACLSAHQLITHALKS